MKMFVLNYSFIISLKTYPVGVRKNTRKFSFVCGENKDRLSRHVNFCEGAALSQKVTRFD